MSISDRYVAVCMLVAKANRSYHFGIGHGRDIGGGSSDDVGDEKWNEVAGEMRVQQGEESNGRKVRGV